MEINKLFSSSRRIFLVIVILFLLVGSGIVYGLGRFSQRLYERWQASGSQASFWEKLAERREEMEKGKDNKASSFLPVRVVSEESQVIDAVKKAVPAVVSIIASAEVPKYETFYENVLPPGMPEEWGNLFNMQVPTQKQNGTEKKQIGAGTGFLVSPDGYIITNKHVVADEKAEYTVLLNDEKKSGEKVVAKVVARDPNNDVAVLKIEKKNLPFLRFGDSDKLQVGQTTIAIGYALGEFDNTVSKGVVSGLKRTVVAGGGFVGTERLRQLIQTDAAINPGNSGGPLLDIGGAVIGVNVAMAQAQSIGFALPINYVKTVYQQARDTGAIKKAESGYLGIRYLIINEKVKSANNLPVDYGALISRGETREELAVTPGSPADKVGLVENDIVLEVDGQKITENNQLSDIVAERKPGDEVSLKIYHRSEEKIIKIKLGQRPIN